jgi:hypothetical protein
MKLYNQYADLVAYLRDNLTGPALARIDEESVTALIDWLDSIDDDGQLEIPARYSVTGSPIVSDWTQYAPDFGADNE